MLIVILWLAAIVLFVMAGFNVTFRGRYPYKWEWLACACIATAIFGPSLPW